MKKQLRLFSAALCSFMTLGFASMDANAQTYCQPSIWMDNSYEWITNVNFAGINNTTGAGAASAYSNFTTTVAAGQVTIGTAATLSVSIEPDSDEYIYAFIDWNHNGILDNAGEKYIVASGVSGTGPYTVSITPPATALTGNTRMRIMLDYLDWNVGDPCLGETELWWEGYGEVEDYTINVQGATTPVVTSIAVATQGGAPATITTNAGTLQMAATVLPATAPQTVTWSIVPGTGTATISAAGLVTAQTNGTVWAKAVSTADVSKKDSLQITLSNQVVPVTSVAVTTQGGAPATITTNAGTLQMAATVLPAAAPQTVTWSIVPGTGTATISAAGLVTAQTNGTVWAKAVSTADASKKDSLQITLSNQAVPVTSVTVATQGGVPAAITTSAGTLQMTATVLPANATQTVTWSIVPGTGTATISAAGLVTAQTNGTVWAKAVSTADASKKDSLELTLSNQSVAVASVSVNTASGVPAAITVNAGTLQMMATVLPANATQSVTWSIVPGTGTATISATGLVSAQTNGTVWAKAVSTADASKHDSLEILISNQGTGVNDLFTSGVVAVYPNPVNNELSIDFKSWTAEVFTISMTNLLGQEVYKASLNNKKTSHNLSNLAPGTYILNLTDAKGNRSGIKINKQ